MSTKEHLVVCREYVPDNSWRIQNEKENRKENFRDYPCLLISLDYDKLICLKKTKKKKRKNSKNEFNFDLKYTFILRQQAPLFSHRKPYENLDTMRIYQELLYKSLSPLREPVPECILLLKIRKKKYNELSYRFCFLFDVICL